MNWRVLHVLSYSVIGKALIILSLVSPISILVGIGIELPLFQITLIGSILITLSHFLILIFTPATISSFPDGYSYALNLLDVKQKDAIDFVSEFEVIEENKAKLKSGYNSFHFKNYQFNTIDKTMEELGIKIGLRSLALMKYDYINNTKILLRWFLSLLMVVGIVSFYVPLILKISVTFGGAE